MNEFGLSMLAQRRQRGDVIQTFKVINIIDDVDPSTWFDFAANDVEGPTRSSVQIQEDGTTKKTLNIKFKKTHLNLRKHFFSNRVINSWNALSETLKCATSVNNLKSGYDKLC